jgi:hypothetical protein
MHAKFHLLRLVPQILALATTLLSTGCATHGLWVNDRLDNFHEPVGPHAMAIYELPGNEDFLVQYDDMAPNGQVLRRSYLLRQNQGATASARKPRFLEEALRGPMLPVPVFPDSKANRGGVMGAYAVFTARTNRFELYGRGQKFVGEYDLPVYPTSAGNVKRVLLTPFTLAADVTIVGGIVAVWALFQPATYEALARIH